MGSSSSFSAIVVLASLLVVVMGSSSAQLRTSYYDKKCPEVFEVVESVVKSAVAKEKRMGASLLRLHFHDCCVQGCDGSILLDDTSSFTGEKTAGPNNNSARGFNVIDRIKAKVEYVCPGVVSCADILAIAARDSVVTLGGPKWDIKVGRKDSKTASFSGANSGMIPPPSSTLNNLINRFQALGLSTKDMVVLSGAHTIGQARCRFYRNRIYNETNINTSFARKRRGNCPRASGTTRDNNIYPMDHKSPTFFDNNYYKNLINKKGLLHSDQILYSGGQTDSFIETYSENSQAFEDDFAAAMIRMGDNALTGSNGEVRKNCRRPN